MTWRAGDRLGPYELVSPLGAGGMGVVWRARDTRLPRNVAVKFLGRELAAASYARDRFEREARALASLSHPNICPLYDVGEQNGELFLVMELLAGVTLADRLRRGPLETANALRIAAEIAAALSAAHGLGIIHRDLKPANVMLTPSGVKLLDFGLAKVAEEFPGDQSITLAKGLTDENTTVGTIQYMSPEQLEARAIDARSDIFSLGCVLYEMFAGQRAFDGDNRASITAKILTAEPQRLRERRDDAPPAVERLIQKCLAKDPSERWQSAKDLETMLQWIPANGGAETSARATGRGSAVVLASILAVGGIIAAYLAGRSVESRRQAIHFTVSPEELGAFGGSPVTSWMAVSPDGSRLVFVAAGADHRMRLWLRKLDSAAATVIAGTEEASSPFWSRDGKEIGFFAAHALKRVAADGGTPVTICEEGEGSATWGAGDTIVFGLWTQPNARLWRVSGRGGVATPLTSIDTSRKETWHYWPEFLPDGNRFLFLRFRQGQRPELCVRSLDNGTITAIMPIESRAVLAPPDRLLYVRGRKLVEQKVDLKSLRVKGDPIAVADQVRSFPSTANAPFSVSADGKVIACHTGTTVSKLVWATREGAERDASSQLRDYDTFRLAHDDQRVLASLIDPANAAGDLWVVNVARDVSTRLTATPADERFPVWSGDEQSILFRAHRPELLTAIEMSMMSARGGAATKLIDRLGLHTPRDAWSRRVLFSSMESENSDLRILNLDGGAEESIAATPANESDGRFSPDGKWIAYTSDESGRSEVYVQAYPPTAEKWRVSRDGGSAPRWRGDGREIYFLARDKTVMSAGIDLPASPSLPVALFRKPDLVGNAYETTSDGTRFLLNIAVVDEHKLPVTVIVE